MSALRYLNATDEHVAERRRHRRIRVRLQGKYMRPNRMEYPCATIEMSCSGAAFAAQELPSLGERIVADIDPIGQIQGVVQRHFFGGFAISIRLPPSKRQSLVDRLTALAARQPLGKPEARAHERIPALYPHTTVTLSNGQKFFGKIMEFSRADASLTLSSLMRAPGPEVGSRLIVGSTPARVVRTFPGGVAVEFARLVPWEDFGEDFKL